PWAKRRTSGPEAFDLMRSAAKSPKASRIADLIGDTPLLPIGRLADHLSRGVRLYAKVEGRNPSGSVKDRAALGMLRAAERSGLSRDEILLDATSGNTGIALAMLGASEGYRVTLCVPANLSLERRRILTAYGAELVFTPATEGTVVPGIWDPKLADEMMFVATEDAQAMARRLARAEGMLVGTSSGAAFDAALRLAERIREGVIVTIFPDAGVHYLGERYWEEAR